jgi:hypothetical protein
MKKITGISLWIHRTNACVLVLRTCFSTHLYSYLRPSSGTSHCCLLLLSPSGAIIHMEKFSIWSFYSRGASTHMESIHLESLSIWGFYPHGVSFHMESCSMRVQQVPWWARPLVHVPDYMSSALF